VKIAAELGQKQCDVENAEQDSTRSVGRRRGSEWHVGLSGGKRWCGRRCDGERR
jgi:hypothetical protein